MSLTGEATVVSRWRYQSRAAPVPRPGDTIAFAARLAAALRAAHATGLAFRLSIGSGHPPLVTLEAPTPASARWMSRTLVPAYEDDRWSARRDGAPVALAGVPWDGVPVRAWPVRLCARQETVGLFDATATALASLPSGAWATWWLRPAPLVRARAPRADPAPRPPVAGRGLPLPVPSAHRAADDTATPGPLWSASCTVRAESDVPGPVERAAHALEVASAGAEASGLRFRPRRWWSASGPPSFPATEADLMSILPSPTSGTLGVGVPPPSTAWILPLGRASSGRVVGPAIEVGQGRHLAILGETGMGKSSLLLALSRRAVDAGGVILLDPIGDTARTLRAELPPEARRRLTWIDTASAPGINALASMGTDSAASPAVRERALNDLVHALRRVRSGRYADAGFWGPRLEEMLTRALRAAAALPGGTLVEAHRLLEAQARGFRLVPVEAMEAVRSLADRIRERPEDADGARRLIYEVVRSPVLARMLCAHPPTLSATDLVAPGRVVLVSGDAAIVGESTARYLLSVYLALVWAELLARSPPAKTFVLLDEAQWFGHESLAEMLRLGRRRDVHVVLATQAVASLPEPVAESLWTNVADLVVFRGSPAEAREVARSVNGVSAEAILALPRGRAIALLGKGVTVEWIRAARIPRAHRPLEAPADDPGAPPPPKDDRPPAAEPGPGELTRTMATAVEAILDSIRQQIGAPADGRPTTVSLAGLRRAGDPGGRGLRAVGSQLGRAGAILAIGRGPNGPCWTIDPRRMPWPVPTSPPPLPRNDARPAQPS
ncbi:MAG TPA: DUF87 domain-containing protein [Thermoplasmata archaeon]|nr:DUF87 domain-containing protein [Thermoplasmata archaeon]